MLGYKSYNSNRGGSASTAVAADNGIIISSGYSYADEEYLNWDFGFVCYMPQNIVIDNFKYHTRFKNVYVYNNIGDNAFGTDISNPYILTKSITYKNMDPLKTVANTQCYKLNSVPVKVEE
jgi:hypothetical protein